MKFNRVLLAALFAASLSPAAFAQSAAPRTTRGTGQRAPARPAAPAPAQGGVNLTAADMALILDGFGFPPEVRARLASDAEERRRFAKDLRQMIATAEEAKSKGVGARPETKLQLELSRAFVIAQEYFKRRGTAGASAPAEVVAPEEIEALFKQPGAEANFDAFLEDYRKNGPNRGAPITDAQRAELRQHYGRVMVGRDKGVAAGLDRERGTQLMVMLQQSRLLAGAYANELRATLKATEPEIDAYIAAHPELDTKGARSKAEEAARRARAGEDFAALATALSGDPGSRGQGGDLGWFGRGVMVKEFEDAAFALKAGEISGVVESPFGYHVIKTEDRRTQPGPDGKPQEQVRARHILILYNAAPRQPGTAPQSPRAQAREAVEREREERALEEFVTRWRVRVAEDFQPGAPGAAASTPPAPATPATQTGTRPGAPAAKPAASSGATNKPRPATRKPAATGAKRRP